MPSRNTKKIYVAPGYYHVYNRGANKSPIFLDDKDREKFLSLIARYLDPRSTERRGDGQAYATFNLQIVAYCLMDNHFHLLIFQKDDPSSLPGFMQALSTAYTMYFNLKYKHSGHLFQSVFKASLILNDAYLLHISRYIHMNPRRYLNYRWSSIRYYLGAPAPQWLDPEAVNTLSPAEYRTFLSEYEGKKAELELLYDELANA